MASAFQTQGRTQSTQKDGDDDNKTWGNLPSAICCVIFAIVMFIIGIVMFTQSNKFSDAPMDECIFTYSDQVSCDGDGCNSVNRKGTKSIYYYNTKNGTCPDNVLNDDSECDCSNNPPLTPDDGYNNYETCWIASCESEHDWTFTHPNDMDIQFTKT